MSVLESYEVPLPGCSNAGVHNGGTVGQAGAVTSRRSPVPSCMEAVRRARTGTVTRVYHSPVNSCRNRMASRPRQSPDGGGAGRGIRIQG